MYKSGNMTLKDGVLIETLWNVNFILLTVMAYPISVLIETLWNVNEIEF